MQLAKSASTSLPVNLRLSQRDCPIFDPEGEIMKSVAYAPVVGSLIYVMVLRGQDYVRLPREGERRGEREIARMREREMMMITYDILYVE